MKPDGSGERLLTEGFHNEGPTWAPNGRVLMFFRDPGGAGPSLYTVDITGRNEQRVPTPSFASDPAWSPLLAADRKSPDSDARFFQDDNGALPQRFFERRQVCDQERNLPLGPAVGSTSKQHDRRLTFKPEREHRAEIGIRRDEHAVLRFRRGEDRAIVGRLQSEIAHVRGIVAASPQAFGDARRQRVVDQKSHDGEASGSSRSRTASAA
jgi:hypothetical protein